MRLPNDFDSVDVEEAEKRGTPDRVWFSDGLKMNLGDYQSADVNAGMSTDVRPGETAEQAFDRARKTVEAQVFAEAKRVRAGLWKQVT